ncbi:MAG: N-acetyltransferase [Microbacteriaceae bacterium]|nr:N-acetyltransferase [Microbacteriaceae bacterium]
MLFRNAEESDLPALLEILNHEIATGTANWSLEPETLPERVAWLRSRRETGHPVIVGEDDDGRVLGYASCGPFRPFDAWAPTVEHSIYLHPDARGRGLGGALLDALLERIAAAGFRNVVATVDATNAPSIRMHERRGFAEVGRMDAVGEKFGHELDAVFLLKRLAG